MYSSADGKLAVSLARRAIESHLRGKQPRPPADVPESFRRKSGVFVTLSTFPDRELRGCIGYPEPVMPLVEAIVDSAVSAASRDPRFDPVTPRELAKLVVEVSLLTPPEIVKVKAPADYLKAIVIGRDGLIADNGWGRGLLLPQVPVEQGWDVHEFLDHTCMKAGLPAAAWTDKATRIFRFTAEIFDELEPGGNVEPRPLAAPKGG
jgi:hypothetical protein